MVVMKTASAAETGMLGEKLGSLLGAGDLVCLYGGLGAGKTCLAQGIARGLGVEDAVSSPTFTLINEYYGRLPLFHMDVYRLDSATEMEDLGYEEYFYDGGVTLVEWAEKIDGLLPADRLDVFIDGNVEEGEEESRKVTFLPGGERFRLLMKELIAVVCPGD